MSAIHPFNKAHFLKWCVEAHRTDYGWYDMDDNAIVDAINELSPLEHLLYLGEYLVKFHQNRN